MATMTTAMRVYLLLAAIVAWAGLLLQLNVSLTIFSDRGLSAAFTVFRMLGYFTILTNLIVASYYTARLLARASPMVEWLASPVVASWIALSISFVAVVYALLLRHLVNLAGWALVADVVLHYVTPALFVFYWVVFVPKGQLRWRHALLWAVYPLGYVTYALIRGRLVRFLPVSISRCNCAWSSKSLAERCRASVDLLDCGVIGSWDRPLLALWEKSCGYARAD